MGLSNVMADVERAGGHVVIVGVLAGLAAVGALAYQLVRVVAKRRGSGTPIPDGPDPTPSSRTAEGTRDHEE
jgi:hypothetical protein